MASPTCIIYMLLDDFCGSDNEFTAILLSPDLLPCLVNIQQGHLMTGIHKHPLLKPLWRQDNSTCMHYSCSKGTVAIATSSQQPSRCTVGRLWLTDNTENR